MPLVTVRTSTLHVLQGTTTDPGLIFHWRFPRRLQTDMRWLECYVALSRVRSLDRFSTIVCGKRTQHAALCSWVLQEIRVVKRCALATAASQSGTLSVLTCRSSLLQAPPDPCLQHGDLPSGRCLTWPLPRHRAVSVARTHSCRGIAQFHQHRPASARKKSCAAFCAHTFCRY